MAPDRRRTKRSPVALHPVLFALSPILFLYSHNASKLPIAPSELLLPLAVSLAATFALWLVLWLVLRSSRRAALIVSLVLALFFLYGRVENALGVVGSPVLLPAAAAAILLLGVLVFSRPRREFGALTVVLNLVSLVLVLINTATGVPALLRGRPARAGASGPSPAETANLPDIYYIILDSYAREDVLRQDYGYDNAGFIDYLRSRGFHIGSRSRSNYAQTYLSLASSLNMTYLDSLAAKTGLESDDRAPLVDMIANSRVVDFLRRHGYTIVSFASGYTGTDLANADVHFAPRRALSEFENVLISTTALPLVLDRVLKRSQYELHREGILYAFRHLPDAARLRHPVFAFSHILSPHPPFVFGAHGEKINPQGYFTITEGGSYQAGTREQVRQEYVERFPAQLQFISAETETMIEHILGASPRPPVIILQADHGPASFRNWDDVERGQLVERMAILNACLVPAGSTGPAWYDSISPVNSFRLVLDRVFGESLPLLPDRSWLSSAELPYRFYDAEQPEAYESALHRRGAPLTLLVFGTISASRPADIALYARRLIDLRYPGEDHRLVGLYFRRPPSGPPSGPAAYQAYRNAVKSGNLPDLGLEPDSYSGTGPDGRPVVALFFAAKEQKNGKQR